MKDRIRQLMDAQHMNQQTFANYIGVNTASLSSVFTGRTSPTLNIVNAIKRKFPNVNTDWLLYGSGGMFNLPNTSSSSSIGGTSPGLFDSAIVAESSNAKVEAELHSSYKNESQIDIVESEKNNASKAIDKPSKHIVEVKIFYSDGTFETLKP